jgi:hypothetical protein
MAPGCLRRHHHHHHHLSNSPTSITQFPCAKAGSCTCLLLLHIPHPNLHWEIVFLATPPLLILQSTHSLHPLHLHAPSAACPSPPATASTSTSAPTIPLHLPLPATSVPAYQTSLHVPTPSPPPKISSTPPPPPPPHPLPECTFIARRLSPHTPTAATFLDRLLRHPVRQSHAHVTSPASIQPLHSSAHAHTAFKRCL